MRDGCLPVIVISKNRNHLKNIEQLAHKELSQKDFKLVKFIQPEELLAILDSYMLKKTKETEIIKGFRIETEFDTQENSNIKNIKSHFSRLFKKKK